MITFVPFKNKSTNIWNSRAQTLVICASVHGLASHGIMADFHRYDPQASIQWQQSVANGLVRLGTPFFIPSTLHPGKQYLICPIKQNSGDCVEYGALEKCLQSIGFYAVERGITSICTHKMGTYRDNTERYLDWESEVKPLMLKYLNQLPIRVSVLVSKGDVPQPTPQQRQYAEQDTDPEIRSIVVPF
jgi:hypothetical protein